MEESSGDQYRERVDCQIVHLNYIDDHIFLSRYFGELRISWRFNVEGRIEKIDGKFRYGVKRGEFSDFLRVPACSGSREDPGWKNSEVVLYDLPREIDKISRRFSSLDSEEKYKELLKRGHSWAHKSYDFVQNYSEAPAEFSRAPQEKPFSDIDESTLTFHILRKASGIYPDLDVTGSGIGELTYSDYRPRSNSRYRSSSAQTRR